MKNDVKVDDERLYDTLSITMELQKPLLEDEKDRQREVINKKKNTRKNILKLIIGLLIMVIVGFVIWANNSYKPKNIALEALVSDESVEVKNSKYISFTPKNVEATKGFIFYPGAKVEPEAYAPLARSIAEAGYEVVIVNMPLNLAIFSPSEAKKVMEEYENIESWVIGGHSLGGVMAAKFASENKLVDGVVLLASYSMGDELKNLGKEVLSIWGSKDGVMNFNSFSESRTNLPEDTTFIEIEGGNHAQFGDYGAQKGDAEAIISQEKQIEITSNSIIDFLDSIK